MNSGSCSQTSSSWKWPIERSQMEVSTIVDKASFISFETRTRLQRQSVSLCLEIRSRNEEAINSTRNRIYSLKVFYFLRYWRPYFLLVTSAEGEVKDSCSSRMLQSCNFGTDPNVSKLLRH